MTRKQAVAAAKEIESLFLRVSEIEVQRSARGATLGHLRWMVKQMAGEMSENKTMRWLGYIQGVLVAKGDATLDEMKDVSRRASE